MSKCIPDINFTNVTKENVRKLVNDFMMECGVEIDNTGDFDENCKKYVEKYLIEFYGKKYTEVIEKFKKMEENPSDQLVSGFTTIQLLYDPKNVKDVYTDHPNPIFMPFRYRMKNGGIIEPDYKSDIFMRIKEDMINCNYTFTTIDDYKFREAVSEIYRSSTTYFSIIKQ